MVYRYIFKRILSAIPTLLGVLIFVFLLTRVIGDPVVVLLPPEASAEQILEMRATLGLDKSLLHQFWIYFRSAVTGDFGSSFWSDRPAVSVVLERFPATLQLALASTFVAILLGIPAGILAALKRNTLVDVGISVGALFGLSMPNFWLGLMMILFFGVTLRWLPISGHGSFAHIIMPALTLGTSMMAILARLMRTDLLDALSREYITTAAAKGLSARRVVLKHALKNALIPTVTLIGLQFGALLGGSVVTETVFAWPGLGRLIIQAIGKRDYPVIQAGVMLFAVFFIVINLVVDLTYAALDPRIKYD